MTKTNQTGQEKVQEIVGVIMAIGGGSVAFLDTFGLLDWLPFLSERVGHLTLLLVAAILGYLILERRSKLVAIETIVSSTQSLVEKESIERVSMLRHQIDPNLNKVFGEHISNLIEGLRTAARDKQVILHDVDTFRFFYQVTLEKFPRREFWATSLPSKTYFWDDSKFMGEMAAFVTNGGTIKRVFYVNMPMQLQTDETQEVLLAQHRAGIEVYITDINKLPLEHRRLFVVEAGKSIAWEVEVFPNARQQIGKIIATSDTRRMDELTHSWDRLLKLPTTERYIPPQQ